MEHDNKIEIFFRLETLKLKEEIQDLYIYQDFNTETFDIRYNDEIEFPKDLFKQYKKKTGKLFVFDNIRDIKSEFSIKEGLVKFTFINN